MIYLSLDGGAEGEGGGGRRREGVDHNSDHMVLAKGNQCLPEQRRVFRSKPPDRRQGRALALLKHTATV